MFEKDIRYTQPNAKWFMEYLLGVPSSAYASQLSQIEGAPILISYNQEGHSSLRRSLLANFSCSFPCNTGNKYGTDENPVPSRSSTLANS
ncbi:hypothetical protein [Neobacillus cucumis]|uniref:hypothetical protein n=1 Tax=Neobacillus cucumis TaxID=1740721 RepID=UPI00406BA5CB